MPNASNAECKPDSVSCQDNSVPDASNVAANGESRPLKPQPCIFVNHGGGPMPLLNSPDQKEITQFLKTTARSIIKKAAPRAILIVSAHWETAGAVHVSSMERPDMIFDYYGFPAETYEYEYPAPGGDSKLVARIVECLKNGNLKGSPAKDGSSRKPLKIVAEQRGFDHGVFIPMMLAWPDADIPVVSMSVEGSLDAGVHLAIGRALAPLRKEGVLIIGSGQAYHNMRELLGRSGNGIPDSVEFADFLVAASKEADAAKRLKLLSEWDQLAAGQASHPRAEHLMPLFVVAGAAAASGPPKAFNQEMMGYQCVSFAYDA